MTFALTLADLVVAALVVLVACVQLFIWNRSGSGRGNARRWSFLRHARIETGFETERGSLTFSLIKSIGLAAIGCLTLAAAYENAPGWQAIAATVLLTGIYVMIGMYVVPQIVYRKSTGTVCWPSRRCCDARFRSPAAGLGARICAIPVRAGRARAVE